MIHNSVERSADDSLHTHMCGGVHTVWTHYKWSYNYRKINQ